MQWMKVNRITALECAFVFWIVFESTQVVLIIIYISDPYPHPLGGKVTTLGVFCLKAKKKFHIRSDLEIVSYLV